MNSYYTQLLNVICQILDHHAMVSQRDAQTHCKNKVNIHPYSVPQSPVPHMHVHMCYFCQEHDQFAKAQCVRTLCVCVNMQTIAMTPKSTVHNPLFC